MRQLIEEKFINKDEIELVNHLEAEKIDFYENRIANGCFEDVFELGISETRVFKNKLNHYKFENAGINNLNVANTINTKNKLRYAFFLVLMFVLLVISIITKEVMYSSFMVSL